MTIRHLEIFKTVYECNSITEAADLLNMSQPAVSISIKELESYYNTKLFNRTRRGVAPTEQGDLLYKRANQLIDQFEEVSTLLRDNKNFVRIRLGANVSVAETALASVLKEIEKFDEDNKNLEIIINNSTTLSKMLENDELDIIITDNVSNISVNDWVKPLHYEDRLVAICSDDEYTENYITIEELATKKLFLRETGSAARACVDEMFAKHGIRIKPSVESTSTLSLIQLARETIGFSIISYPIAESLNSDNGIFKRVKIVDIKDEKFVRKFYLVYDTSKQMSPTMKKFIEQLSKL